LGFEPVAPSLEDAYLVFMRAGVAAGVAGVQAGTVAEPVGAPA
jgi:hypothetical protein